MSKASSFIAFESWWWADEQAELRASCAMGWGLKIWRASRERMKSSGVCTITVTNSTGESISMSDVVGFEVIEFKGA